MVAIAPLAVLAASAVYAAPAPQQTFTPASGPIPPVRSSQVTGHTSHGPYNGPAPTITGALSKPARASAITAAGPPTVTYVNTNGELQADYESAPFQPAGGQGVNGTEPYYHPLSDFDYESLTLALYQEWIELDLFHYGLATYSVQDFEDAGLTAEDRFLIEFMADQEVGHATLLSNILGEAAPPQCTYNYPVSNVREYIDFNQKLTRFGESGVYGFLGHLDSRDSATLLLQSITTEARQQMAFRQFDGLFPMPVWFEVGIPQSWAWTLLAPYISSCPANTTRLAWANFPALSVLNQPNPAKTNPNLGANQPATGANPLNTTGLSNSNLCLNNTNENGGDCPPAITNNKTIPLSYPGRAVQLSWSPQNQTVGPNNSYVTQHGALADQPRYAMFVSQLNATYVPLVNVSGNTGVAIQPNMSTFAGDPAVNGTMFVAITSQNPYVTPFNLSNVNSYVYAGPALYQSG